MGTGLSLGKTEAAQAAPELVCLWGGPSVLPSALAHVTLVSWAAEMSWESAALHDLCHLCCSWWQVPSVTSGDRQGSVTPPPLSELHLTVTCACLLWVCSQAFRAC